MNSRPKKSPSSKARKVGRVTPCAPPPANQRVRVQRNGARGVTRPTIKHPTQLERDTMLTPLWVAESVVQEVERFLKAELPENFTARLAAKAHYLYPRHRHYHQMLNRPGNFGLHNLRVYMRHWTAGWLRRERYALFKRLPWSFGNGHALPSSN